VLDAEFKHHTVTVVAEPFWHTHTCHLLAAELTCCDVVLTVLLLERNPCLWSRHNAHTVPPVGACSCLARSDVGCMQ